MSMKEHTEQILHAMDQDVSVEDAVRKVLGADTDPEGLRALLHPVMSQTDALARKYAGMKASEAVLQELRERCGEDRDLRFHKMSDLKYMANCRNLAVSKSVLSAQGADTDYMEEAFRQAYESEQQMVQVTEEEAEALEKELIDALPESGESFLHLMQSEGADEETRLLAEQTVQKATARNREDFAVAVAAAYLHEHPDAGPQTAATAAASAVIQTTGGDNAQVLSWLLDAMDASLSVMIAGPVLIGLSELTGISILSSVGALFFEGGAVMLGLLAILVVGGAAAVGLKKLPAWARKAWQRCRPVVTRVAARVKNAALALFGVVRDHVFRPAICWVSNTALPALRKHVIHPLQRRIRGLLEWLRTKWEQTKDFIRSATIPQEAAVQTDGADAYSHLSAPVMEDAQLFAAT